MSKRITTILIVVLVVAALIAAVGCQRGGGGGGGGEAKIGLSISTLNNPFFVTMRSGAQQAAKDQGVQVLVADAQNDSATQQDDVQNFVTQQVDAILVNPVDPKAPHV